jgi:hypothetical protein
MLVSRGQKFRRIADDPAAVERPPISSGLDGSSAPS